MERIRSKNLFEHNPGDHVARYMWALLMVARKTTLDCGCGEGYGTVWLRKQGIDVIGLDCSRQAFFSSKMDALVLADVRSIPFRESSFEAIISFEVIEHLEDGDVYLSKICDVLTPDGIFIGSTPIRKPKKYQNGRPKNPFHKKEYYIKELSDLLKKHFENVTMYGQIFPSTLAGVFLSQLHKLKLLQSQQMFYQIHDIVAPSDEKCLWVAMKPKKHS